MHSIRILAAAALALTVDACLRYADVQCIEDSNCNLSYGGLCLTAPTGHHWCAYPDPNCSTGYRYSDQAVGDGVSAMCTESNGMDSDAGAPGHAPITSGEFADEVFGQNDLTSGFANSGGISGSSLNRPLAVTVAGTHLWVTDASNARLLQWNAIPVVDRPLANIIIGQKDSTSVDSITGQSTLRIGVSGISGAADHLFVADYPSNRILVFSPLPAQTGVPASIVLGQGSFTTSDTGKSASGLYNPYDVWSDGIRIAVADTANSRVLIWNSIPVTNGKAADIVIGRSDFGLGVGDPVADPPTNASMKAPHGVWSNGTRLYVADSENHRVLVWRTFPTTNGARADFVLGQPSFELNSPNAGGANANALGFSHPTHAIEANGALFVSDPLNHRVVMFYPIPDKSGAAASGVLGQDNLTSSLVPDNPVGNRLSDPRYIAATTAGLYVPDYQWNRVIRFPFR